MPLAAVVMGSQSDAALMQGAVDTLGQLGVATEVVVMSAHRTPAQVQHWAQEATGRGVEIVIAGAGGAAALPGVLASWLTIPVIGVPLPTSDLRGVDALLAIVQMPPGVPVATVGIGAWGAKNAAYLAAQILGMRHEAVRKAYEEYRRQQAG